MKNHRMFSLYVIDSDQFLDMPLSTQATYLHLCMRADDDGFINNPKKIQRMIGASEDDLKLLIAKQFVIPFETGVVVIKHWRMHNYIRKDMYKSSLCVDEKSMIEDAGNGTYQLRNVSVTDTSRNTLQERNGNVTLSISKDKISKDKISKGIIDTSCTELSQNSVQDIAEDVPSIVLNDGSEWRPTIKDMEEWTELYSGVDVKQELGKMRQWCKSNPAKRKTARGVRRFVTSWLDRAQNNNHGYYSRPQRQATGADAYFEMAQEAINGTC